MAYRPSLKDFLVISKPYNWFENRFVKDKDGFYDPGRFKYSLVAGAFLYAATAGGALKIYQNLDENWHYQDLSPTISLINYNLSEEKSSSSKLLWSLFTVAVFWAGDSVFLYAYRNRKHNRQKPKTHPASQGITPTPAE